MITYILYNKDSEHERTVASFVKALESDGVAVELIEADSLRGVALTENYDLTQRPAVVLAGPDGTVIERWVGALPPAGDVRYLFHR